MEVKIAEPVVIEQWPVAPEQKPPVSSEERIRAARYLAYLELVENRLQMNGWIQGNYGSGGVGYCLLGAANAEGIPHYSFAEALGFSDPGRVVGFNDDRRRTFAGIKRRLRKRMIYWNGMLNQ